MSSLYELTGNFLTVQEMLESDEFDKETLDETLNCIEYEIEVKADNYAKIIKNLETVQAKIKGQKDALKTAVKDEIDRLSNKEKSIDNKIKHLKENLSNAMRITGKEKVKTDLFSFYFKKNQAVNVINEAEALKSKFIKTETKLDKVSLLAAMKNGEKFDFADIKESESLIIR